MLNKKLLTTFCLVAGMLLPQGVWAQSKTLTELTACFSLTTNSREDAKETVISDDETTSATGGTFEAKLEAYNTVDGSSNFRGWLFESTSQYLKVTLSGHTIAAGDILRFVHQKKTASAATALFNIYDDADKTNLLASIRCSTLNTTNDLTTEYRVESADGLCGKSTFYIFLNPEGTLRKHCLKSVNILPSSVDALDATKTWDMNDYSVKTLTGPAVNEKMCFGNNTAIITVTNGTNSFYKEDKTSANGLRVFNFNRAVTVNELETKNYLMFMVPAGYGTVSITFCPNGNQNTTKKLYYNIGSSLAGQVTFAGTDISSKDGKSRYFTTKKFNYEVPTSTPVYLYVNGGDAFYISEITVTPGTATTGEPYNALSIRTIDYATVSSSLALDFTNSGADAYIVTDETSGKLTYEKVTKVKAGTGLLLVGTAGTSCTPTVIADAEATDYSATNLLKATLSATTVGDTGAEYGNVWVLGNKSGAGFYKANNGRSLTVGKAYLYLDDGDISTAREFYGFDFENETTGIEAINNNRETINDNHYYNLNGQRVANPTKGLYIVNGKKVMIK